MFTSISQYIYFNNATHVWVIKKMNTTVAVV